MLQDEMVNIQNNTSISKNEAEAELDNIKSRLNSLLSYKIKGMQVRARANQIELNEKSTKFFYKQEKINNDKKKNR